MSSEPATEIGRDELVKAVDFMRAGDWILRVLDPRRPPLREITEWAESVRAAGQVADPRVAARLIRPQSVLAVRLAENVATLMSAGDEAHRLASQAQIRPGVPIREAALSFVYAAGVLPENTHFNMVMMAVRERLIKGAGGLTGAYEELRAAFAACALAPEAADTERTMLAERVRAYRQRREPSPSHGPVTLHARSCASGQAAPATP